MVRASKGFRSKTRRKLKKRGKRTTITESLKEFNTGERVVVKINPSIHKGMPHPRFYGRSGIVIEKRGNAYSIQIKDGNKQKILISRPEHLKVIA